MFLVQVPSDWERNRIVPVQQACIALSTSEEVYVFL
jgi:hypothetical protein